MSKIKSMAVAALAIAAVVSLSACTTASEHLGGAVANPTGSSGTIAPAALDTAAAALLPAAVKARGTLIVGTDPTFSPYEFYGSNNTTVAGWDADFAAAIGQVLGLKVVMTPSSFDAILPGLTSGKYDVGMSAFSNTPQRRLNADFANYLDSGSGIAVAPGNPKHLSVTDPMSLCGTTAGGEKGTTQGITTLPQFSAACVKAGKAPITIQLFPSQDGANLALMSGRVTSVMSDGISLAYQSKLADGKFELAKGEQYQPTPTAVALPKGSPLTPAIRAAVEKLVASSTYQAINAKYGVPDSATVTAAMVAKNL